MGITRRRFLVGAGTVGAASVLGVRARPSFAANAGKPVEARSLITCTAQFDPVRPQIARLIDQACKRIGFSLTANPIEYNDGIQKVFMQHDFDAYVVRLSGTAIRIDPNVFIYQVHDSSQYKKGGLNFTGYSNPALDKLAEAQQTEMDLNKRRDLVFKAQALIDHDQPEHVIVNPMMTNAYRSDRIANLVPLTGEGIGSFWTDINMTVLKGNGYVRTGATSPLKNLNPVSVIDTIEFEELRMIYDRLMRITPNGTPQPWAAKSVKLVNPTTIDMVLRGGMKFHDGKPVTAEDVKFSFDFQKQYAAPFFNAALKKLRKIEITGRHAMRFHLSEPYAPVFVALFSSMFILPRHIWKDVPAKGDPLTYANENPIGSGPFKFDHWNRGEELKVSAFKEHFHPPKVAGVIRITYGSHDAMAAAIERGECDRTRYILEPSLMDEVNKVKGCVGKAFPSHGWYDFAFNHKVAPFNDPAIRRALQYVVPTELIRDAVLRGYATSGGSVIGPANKFWHDPSVKPAHQDIAKAKQILAKAGYTWEGGKLHYPA